MPEPTQRCTTCGKREYSIQVDRIGRCSLCRENMVTKLYDGYSWPDPDTSSKLYPGDPEPDAIPVGEAEVIGESPASTPGAPLSGDA